MTPRPFTISVPADVLGDLGARLGRVRWPDTVPGGGWSYGTDLAYLRDLVAYWRDVYDWRRHEADLNRLRQFTVPLAGIELHFVHEPGVGPAPLPLLLSHGWPGSIVEFQRLIPLLTDPARFGADPADAFTVVAPSLPGYAFSFHPDQPRFGVVEIAEAFATLMTDVLGYDRFAAQGGDWGGFITSYLGATHPDRLAGIHVNLLAVRRDASPTASATPEEKTYFAELEHWQREETGYLWIQGTRPQTLAYGLTDSPAGLAAWIVEKFRSWSDCGGDVERRFSKDELLTHLTIYWATGTIHSANRLYFERDREPRFLGPGERVEVPCAVTIFPADIDRPPREWAERSYNLARFTVMPRGGHFAEAEEPELVAESLRAFFRPLRT
jgi:microsomal epoxide hydrolase